MASHAFASFVCPLLSSLSFVPSSPSSSLRLPHSLIHSHCVYNRNPFILHFYDRNSFHFISLIRFFPLSLSLSLEKYEQTHTLTHHAAKEKTTKMALIAWIKLQISRNLFVLSSRRRRVLFRHLIQFLLLLVFFLWYLRFVSYSHRPSFFLVSNSYVHFCHFLFQFQSAFFSLFIVWLFVVALLFWLKSPAKKPIRKWFGWHSFHFAIRLLHCASVSVPFKIGLYRFPFEIEVYEIWDGTPWPCQIAFAASIPNTHLQVDVDVPKLGIHYHFVSGHTQKITYMKFSFIFTFTHYHTQTHPYRPCPAPFGSFLNLIFFLRKRI